MRDTCATVRVVAPVSAENPHGHIVINASDLTDEHTLFDVAQDDAEKEAAPRKTRARKTEHPE
jgi:hypothetical protein